MRVRANKEEIHVFVYLEKFSIMTWKRKVNDKNEKWVRQMGYNREWLRQFKKVSYTVRLTQ